MAKLRPYIYSDNAREQAEFYVEALGGEIISVQTFGELPYAEEKDKDRVMHLIMKVAGITFYMADSDSNRAPSNSKMDLTLEFATDAETTAAFTRLSKGGKVIMPIERMFWGSLFGRFEDKFGVKWQIATEVAN